MWGLPAGRVSDSTTVTRHPAEVDGADGSVATPPPATAPDGSSRAEALRSTSIIGGSSVVMLLIRMVRTKIIAVVLGPGGVGLEALFDSIVTLARTMFDGGFGPAGVRQIAAASETGGIGAAARTAFVLRRVYLVLGVAGMLIVYASRAAISRVVFGSDEQSAAIGLLSLTLLCTAAAGAQGVVLNGLRRIGDLARVNVWGTLAGAVISVPIVLVWGRAGIAPSMVLTAAATLLVSSYYVRRVQLPAVWLPSQEVLRHARPLMKLGAAFLVTSLMGTGTILVLRVMVTRQAGIDAAGYFQAASALSMVYVGFILTAMGTDYFPRLTAVADDHVRCNRMVNDQSEVSFLLALPGILATVALAPWVVTLLYSDRFLVASDILMWQMAGMFLRLAAWPMGYILMAKGRGTTFVLADALAWSIYVGLAWVGLHAVGLAGVGMAFLGCYAAYTLLIYLVVREVTGFSWSRANVRLLMTGGVSITCAFVIRRWAPDPWATILGSVLSMMVGLHCLRAIVGIPGLESVHRRLPRWLVRLVAVPVSPGRAA
jgi:enterobacterial common antigen flippase